MSRKEWIRRWEREDGVPEEEIERRDRRHNLISTLAVLACAVFVFSFCLFFAPYAKKLEAECTDRGGVKVHGRCIAKSCMIPD